MLSKAREHTLWLDAIRGAACLLVILLHTCAPYLPKYETIPLLSWNIANALDSMTRMSVPLFFAISGAIFFQEKYPQLTSFIKILSNLILYSIIYIIYIYIRGWPSIQETIGNSLNNPVFYHLWFFYYIIPFYLIMCIVKIRNVSAANVILIITVLFLLFNPQIGNLLFIGKLHGNRFMLDGEFIFYVFYGVAGAAVSLLSIRSITTSRTLAIVLPIILITSILFITLGTKYTTIYSGKFYSPLYNYTSIPVYTSTLSTLMLYKLYYIDNIANKFLRIVGNKSLAIFGIHALFLDIIFRYSLRDFSNPIPDIAITFVITVVGSYIFATVVSKLSPWKKIF